MERDERATDRTLAAGQRSTAAADRDDAHVRGGHRPATWAGEGTAEAREQQGVIDEEMESTRREQAEDDRARTAADRAADDADREAARRDRTDARLDRDAARVDREAAARDRAASAAEREQDEIDWQSRAHES